jgi:protocatechuate 3,4-dioxygenase beta subunit
MKPCFRLAYCLLLATVLAAQTSTTETPSKESENCTVEEHVLLASGEQPLKKVTIRIFSDDEEENSYTTLTDAEGHFKIEAIKPGHYNVRIERNGFLEAGKHRGRYHSQALTLKLGQELNDLVYRMQPAAVIAGKIVDAEGDPVAGAIIYVTRSGSGARSNVPFGGYQRTNDLGEYRIFDLPPGRYLILAHPLPVPATPSAEIENAASSKTETVYVPTYYPGVMDKSQATAIELHAGDQVPANLALVMSSSFRIRGTVSALPIAVGSEIRIAAVSKTDSNLHNSGGSIDKDGKFEIRNVLPGSYTLSLVTSGDGRFSQEINTGQTVEITNTDVNGLQIQPAPNGQVNGQFHVDFGQKVDWSQTTVRLDPDEDSGGSSSSRFGGVSSRFSEVKSDGSFELKNVPAGTYHLIASSRAQAMRDYFVKSINLGSKDVSDTGFTTGGASYSLDIMISTKGAIVEGTVLDTKDQPVVDAEVVAIPDPTRRKRRDLYQQDSTDQRGHFTLHGLNPGRYTVIAFEDLDDDYSDPDFLKSYEGRGQSVEIKEGERKTVQLKVVPSTEEQP